MEWHCCKVLCEFFDQSINYEFIAQEPRFKFWFRFIFVRFYNFSDSAACSAVSISAERSLRYGNGSISTIGICIHKFTPQKVIVRIRYCPLKHNRCAGVSFSIRAHLCGTFTERRQTLEHRHTQTDKQKCKCVREHKHGRIALTQKS